MQAKRTFELTEEGRNTSFLRTARKPWVCVVCEQPIAPGSCYVEYMANAEPRYGATGERYCIGCADETGLVLGYPERAR